MAVRLPAVGSGMVVGVPIPEQHAAAGQQIEAAVDQALSEAAAQGIVGAQTTPFLLERVRQLTGGASLEANIKLVLNNAKVGAELAAAVAALRAPSRL